MLKHVRYLNLNALENWTKSVQNGMFCHSLGGEVFFLFAAYCGCNEGNNRQDRHTNRPQSSRRQPQYLLQRKKIKLLPLLMNIELPEKID